MPSNATTCFAGVCLGLAFLLTRCVAQGEEPQVDLQDHGGQVEILVDGRRIASYVYRDAKIPRPYFAHVKTLNQVQVTRRHPPREGVDANDHALMHPGIWLAFGDLSGADFWRNKARISHAAFVQPPAGGRGKGGFVERLLYQRDDGEVICEETFRCSVRVLQSGYLLTWDATFRSPKEFSFGDQEEMGLGVRVATSMSEQNGGRLLDAAGRQGAGAIWSEAAPWCDYSGRVGEQQAGLTLMCHPKNFRPSWMHARDYGFVAANPFGAKAMRKGELSSITVRPKESMRLRYAVWVHDGLIDREGINEAYHSYQRLEDEAE